MLMSLRQAVRLNGRGEANAETAGKFYDSADHPARSNRRPDVLRVERDGRSDHDNLSFANARRRAECFLAASRGVCDRLRPDGRGARAPMDSAFPARSLAAFADRNVLVRIACVHGRGDRALCVD